VSPVLQLLGSGALGALLLAVVNGIFSKRKLSAEATNIITKAASGVVERLEKENTRQSARLESQQATIDSHARLLRQQGEAIAIHAFWDNQAFTVAKDHGIDLPEPPPLTINPTGN
jgi:hypothetical protein